MNSTPKTPMKRFNKFTLDHTAGAIEITLDQAATLGITPDTEQLRGEMRSFGPWQIPISYRAIRVSGLAPGPLTVYGPGTLCNVQSLGYEIEGRVKVDGKRVRGFSSSQLFQLPGGHLVDVAVIHCCMNQPK